MNGFVPVPTYLFFCFWPTCLFLLASVCKQHSHLSFSKLNSWNSSSCYILHPVFLAHPVCHALDLLIDEALLMSCCGLSVHDTKCLESSHCVRWTLSQASPARWSSLLSLLSAVFSTCSLVTCGDTVLQLESQFSGSVAIVKAGPLGQTVKLKFLFVSFFWW
jgi:hypothetical protein